VERRKKRWQEKSVEKVGKNLNFFAKSSDLKHAYLSELPMILLVYKETHFNSDNLDLKIKQPHNLEENTFRAIITTIAL
jgi:hypothetical protein